MPLHESHGDILHGYVTNESLNSGVQASLDQRIPLANGTPGGGPGLFYQVVDARTYYTNDKVAAIQSALAAISYGGVYVPMEWGLIQTPNQIQVPGLKWLYSGSQYGVDPTTNLRAPRIQATGAMTSVVRLMAQSAGIRGMEVDANNLATNGIDADAAAAQVWAEKMLVLNHLTGGYGIDFGQIPRSGLRDIQIAGNGGVGTGVRLGVDALFGGTNRIKTSAIQVELHGGGAMMGGTFHLTGAATSTDVLLFSGTDCVVGGAIYTDTCENNHLRFSGNPGSSGRNRFLGGRGRNSPSAGAAGKSVVLFDASVNPCVNNFIMGFTIDRGSRATGWDNFMDFVAGAANGPQFLGAGIVAPDCTNLYTAGNRGRFVLAGAIALGGGGWAGAPNQLFSQIRTSTLFSGDGATVLKTIPHGMCGTPSYVNVTPGSNDAAAHFFVTADATNIYINALVPWPSAAGNVTYYIEAEV